MKTCNRFAASALIFFLLLPTFSACKKSKDYTDALSAGELALDVQTALSGTKFLTAETDYLTDYVALPDQLTDFQICFAADGNNLDEFGICHTDAATAELLRSLLHTYLNESLVRNKSFYDSYIPQETPKLRDAEVRVFGNYVAYAILDSADRKTFFHTLEADLLPD